MNGNETTLFRNNVNNIFFKKTRACGSSARLSQVSEWWEILPRAAAALPAAPELARPTGLC